MRERERERERERAEWGLISHVKVTPSPLGPQFQLLLGSLTAEEVSEAAPRLRLTVQLGSITHGGVLNYSCQPGQSFKVSR